MSIIIGRKHGNGYHDNVCCKISVNFSKKVKDLREKERNQLEKHSGVIYEHDYFPSWVKRVCIRCDLTYPLTYMEKQENIFVCSECGLIKVPKGVDYK